MVNVSAKTFNVGTNPNVPICSAIPRLNMNYSPLKTYPYDWVPLSSKFSRDGLSFFLLLQAVLTTKLAPSFTCTYCYEVV